MSELLGKVAIIDDEAAIRFTLQKALTSYSTTLFNSAEEALAEFAENSDYDIVIVDYRLPGISGLEFLVQLKELLGSYKAMLITAYSNDELLRTLVNDKLVYKIFNKPFKVNNMKAVVNSALEELRLERLELSAYTNICDELVKYKAFSSSSVYGKHQLIYGSELMQKVEESAKREAATNKNILLYGENGVGKELFAQLIHEESARCDKPFIRLDCSTIPEHLFESEILGHSKKDFGTALSDKPGKFQLANGGTLFIDEINELPLQLQAKLFKVVSEKQITPIGSEESLSLDVRIVCATHRDLDHMASLGLFRRDLLNLLQGYIIEIPSLRDRKGDIRALASYFLYKLSNEEGISTKEITREALDLLEMEPFREHNVRGLQSLIHKLLITVEHDFITADDVRALMQKRKSRTTLDGVLDLDNTVTISEFKNIAETAYLKAQLEKFDFHVTRTADALGLHVSNLSRKLKKFNISHQNS